MKLTRNKLAKMIDSSAVNPSTTYFDIEQRCKEAKTYNFYSVSVNSAFISYTKELLKDTDIKVVGNVGFPFGVQTTKVKILETRQVIEDGANEIDVVMNIGKFKSGDYGFVEAELRQIIELARELGEKSGNHIITKVIIEIGWLTDEEIIEASRLVSTAKADFVKTASGFGPRGPTLKDVELIKKGISGGTGIKVAQGVRTFQQASEFIRAGVTRIGTSSPVNIIQGFPKDVEFIEI
ncbi:MAG: deoxyribose-phosphate aldolase [Aigarchaeota archaeon]|nr:deoxyribose-phosphate aldolase [Candidatus Calditenuaceae archaeon]